MSTDRELAEAIAATVDCTCSDCAASTPTVAEVRNALAQLDAFAGLDVPFTDGSNS